MVAEEISLLWISGHKKKEQERLVALDLWTQEKRARKDIKSHPLSFDCRSAFSKKTKEIFNLFKLQITTLTIGRSLLRRTWQQPVTKSFLLVTRSFAEFEPGTCTNFLYPGRAHRFEEVVVHRPRCFHMWTTVFPCV